MTLLDLVWPTVPSGMAKLTTSVGNGRVGGRAGGAVGAGVDELIAELGRSGTKGPAIHIDRTVARFRGR